MLWVGLDSVGPNLVQPVENEVPQKTKNGSPTLGHNIQRKHPNKKHLCVHSSTVDSSQEWTHGH